MARSSPLAPRAGLTTIDALTALVVLAVGVLALGGVAAAVLRGADDGETRRRAAALARRALDSLRATPCAHVAGGADSIPGARVRWAVVDSGAVRLIRATLDLDQRGTTRSEDYELAVPCK